MYNFLIDGLSFDIDNDNFIFNISSNNSQCNIDLANIELEKSSIFYNTYFYGYKFNSNIPNNVIINFLNAMKNFRKKIKDEKDAILKRFLVKPIKLFEKELYKFGCVVYSTHQITNVNYILIEYVGNYVLTREFIELSLFKKENININFDFAAFERYQKGRLGKRRAQCVETINRLLEGARGEDERFALAASSKPAFLRKYFYDFLGFKNPAAKEALNAVRGADVLLLDDAQTGLAALRESLRAMNSVFAPKSVTVVTALGKNYDALLKGN
jgi:hypothetical protein